MTPKINNLGDIYNLVKDRSARASTRMGTVYKYVNNVFNVFDNYSAQYYIVIDNPDIFKRLWLHAQHDANPLYRIVKWYYHSLILPTQCRLINESTQGVLLRIAIGMVYKTPFSLEDKQIIYNDLINCYKKVKLEVDKQYAKYLAAYDRLPF